jgi:hypothetical protein
MRMVSFVEAVGDAAAGPAPDDLFLPARKPCDQPWESRIHAGEQEFSLFVPGGGAANSRETG